ncbi:MAG: DUF3369 domain-containing protein [Mariprofundales bacterium]
MSTPLKLKNKIKSLIAKKNIFQTTNAQNNKNTACNSPYMWNILVVDDDEEVHAVTRMILADIVFQNRTVQLAHAYSAADAKQKLKACNSYAMILLDVVMESEHAGLKLARWIRKTLKNTAVRIVLRTGQPGQAPESTVIMEYDINDYKTKTELTAQKLTTTVITALRSYNDIISLQRTKVGMQQILNSADSLFRSRSMKQFASGVLSQLSTFLDCEPNGILCVRDDDTSFDSDTKGCNLSILASAGTYSDCINCQLTKNETHNCDHLKELKLIYKCIDEGNHVLGDKQVLYLDGHEQHAAVLINTISKPDNADIQLLQLFISKISLALQNVYLYEKQEQIITKRTQQLAKARDNLQDVLDHMPDVYMRITKELRVSWSSKAVASVFGYSEQDISGFNLTKLFVDKNIFLQLQTLLSNNDIVHNFKAQMRHKDGHICWISGSWRILADKSYEGLLRDVTQDVEAEEQRKKMNARIADMQHLESLGVLAGGIAHDFNNIMAVMVGNAELLHMDAEDNLPFNNELALTIIDSGEKATLLCQQMLAYSGQGQYAVEALDITKLINDNIEIFKLSIGSEHILKTNFTENLPTFDADIKQIKQIIIIILTNASEAMRRCNDKKIFISTGMIDLNQQCFIYNYLLPETKKLVFIEVEDFGVGMDDTVLPRIFDPFFSTQFIGRGLGLSAVMGIVRNHNGAINVYSTSGKGTRVIIYFSVA